METHRPKVDYSLRPAKDAVRQMVITALARLGPLMSLESYRYIGMGSIYFRDFQLVHRQLGITDMISIEGDMTAEERVRFNLPLACIDLQMGSTSDVLPSLALDEKPHIVWLDYESRVASDVLADITETVGNCAPGSILIITVNADRPPRGQREAWLADLGSDRPSPSNPREKGEYALLSYKMLRERINTAVDDRNAGLRDPERRVGFRQVFHLVYADGAQMLTVGGGLVAETNQQAWDACEIESLEFARKSEEPCRVEVPRLTRREVHRLLQEMPESQGDIVRAATEAGISPKEAREFAAVYRYAPLFVAAEDW